MRKDLSDIFRKLSFVAVFCLLFFSFSYLAIAATDSIQVNQTVGEEGDGTEPEGGSGGGIILPIDATPPEITDLKIYDIGLNVAKISFQTDEVCLVEIYYGTTKEYLSGPLYDHSGSYESTHDFSLEGLTPGSKYYIKIIIKNQKSVENVITSYSFYTIPEFKTMPDVGSLTAAQDGENIVLDWNNPQVEDFQGVQISRQTGMPALSPDEGEKVFFGLAESFVDVHVSDMTKYYYTVFVFDTAGNFSSGVVVSIKTDFSKEEGDGTGENQDSADTDQDPTGENVFIKDVRSLKSVADVVGKKITLSWEYAEIEVASEVEIRRDTNFPAMSPWEGESVYSGAATSFEDRNLKKGQMYFYTVYAKTADGRYSNGSIIAAELKESAPQPSDQDQWEDMSFVHVDSGILLSIHSGNEISVLQDSTLGINYGIETLPDGLKAVAVQLGNSSYLLGYNEDSKSYKTSFVTPSKPGEYVFNVVFMNAGNEVFFEKNMKLRVLPRGKVLTSESESLFDAGISLGNILCRLENLFGGSNPGCMMEKTVPGAEVLIYRKNRDGVWEIWNAKQFNQENPFLSDTKGEYGAYLANGEYEVGVGKNGFRGGKKMVTVANNILGEDILIDAEKDRRYATLILILLLVLIIRKLRKRFLHIERK